MNSANNKINEMLRSFDYEDLAPHSRVVGREFHDLALWMVNDLTGCATALQKLLEARNCALQCVQHKDAD